MNRWGEANEKVGGLENLMEETKNGLGRRMSFFFILAITYTISSSLLSPLLLSGSFNPTSLPSLLVLVSLSFYQGLDPRRSHPAKMPRDKAHERSIPRDKYGIGSDRFLEHASPAGLSSSWIMHVLCICHYPR